MRLPGEQQQSGEFVEMKQLAADISSHQIPPVATNASGSSKKRLISDLNNERVYVGLLHCLYRWLLRCLLGRQAAKAESLGSFTAITDHGLDHAKHPRLLQDFLELLPGKMPNLAAPAHPGLFYLYHDPNMY